MPILLKTRVKRTAKTLIPARRARVGGLCGFRGTAERVPAGSPKIGRCANVREHCGHGKRRKRTAAGEFQQREKPAARGRKRAHSAAKEGGLLLGLEVVSDLAVDLVGDAISDLFS